jgi:hypothetical protein
MRLIERFDRERESYRSGRYNETQVRREFIDPMFEALGWDMDNKQGYAEAYKDVVHEDAIKVGAATKAPDYCFRVGGTRKFFLEAKKPSVNVKDDIAAAFQLRRYAWSAKLPLSLLTDFEEFAVYDCRVKPEKFDKSSTARILYVTFDQYPDRWDDIAGIFSREAIPKGSFDRFAESAKAKRGTAEVDAAFLAEIEAWRERLARNLALRNPGLTQRELNFAVQQTIDRIVFLRICEDRRVEPYGQLREAVKGDGAHSRLRDLFVRADQRYNSGLFHFASERERVGIPDVLTPSLQLDDKVLRDIITTLYYPDSPYEFSVLPADILGQVYEQFLGKVIRITPGHRAVVEDKPEVKKAGGIYYTPTPIVDHIVRKTIRPLLEGKSPKQASELRILDPACGSGSFLIGAYQYLLDWHQEWYASHDPSKYRKELYEHGSGDFRLTTSERKRILLANIHGVDIDLQAVEVTKLSLLLKVLEGESSESLQAQLQLLQERALPDLDDNIKCGNSLIGPKFYENRVLDLFTDDDRWMVNVFDWKSSYPAVFGRADAGFDAVIGNPPYVRIQSLREWAPVQAEYYKKRYQSAGRGNYDLYVVFVERGLALLNLKGRLGFILPSKFLTTDYGAALRHQIAGSRALDCVVDFGHDQVFPQATTYTCLLFLDRRAHDSAQYVRTTPGELGIRNAEPNCVSLDSLTETSWLLAGGSSGRLLAKLLEEGIPLLQLPATMSRGTSTGNDHIFCVRATAAGFRTRAGEPVEIEPAILRKPVWATDYTRFSFRPKNEEMLIFPYEVRHDGYRLLAEEELRAGYPSAYRYLSDNRQLLERRKQFRAWYGFSAPRNLDTHERADFLVPLLANRGLCAPLPSDAESLCLMASGGFSVKLAADSILHPYFVLGLVNSRLLFWLLRQLSNKFRGGWITCTKQYFGTLPIAGLELATQEGQLVHDRITGLVRHAVGLSEKLKSSCDSHERDLLNLELGANERQLDRAVYDLYGLSEDEIALVEASLSDEPRPGR